MISADEALDRFLRSTASFLALVEGAGVDAWLRRPPGEEWSIADTVEHVVVADRATLTRFQRNAPESGVVADQRLADEQITEQMFAEVATPPNLAEPTGRFATREEGVAALVAVRDEIAAYVRETAPRLREFGAPHPVFGIFDGVQWVLFLGVHTGSHIPQLRQLTS